MKVSKERLRKIIRESVTTQMPGLGFGSTHRDPLSGYPKSSGFSLAETLGSLKETQYGEYTSKYPLEVTVEQYMEFTDAIREGMGWIDPDYVADSWDNMFNHRLSNPALEYLKHNLDANGLLQEDTGEDW